MRRFKVIVLATFLVAFITITALLPTRTAAAPAAAAPLTCSASCHAAGMAQLQAQVAVEQTAVERGRTCWAKAPHGVIPRTVIARSMHGTTVAAFTLDTAWARNHNASAFDDLWVLAVCR